MSAYFETYLRVPGARTSDTAAAWLNGVFRARGIRAAARGNTDHTIFARVTAPTALDLERAVSVLIKSPRIVHNIMLDVREHHRSA